MEHLINYVCVRVRVCVCVCVCSSCVFPGGLGLEKKQIINASNCYSVRYAEPSNKESWLEKSSDGDFVQHWIYEHLTLMLVCRDLLCLIYQRA